MSIRIEPSVEQQARVMFPKARTTRQESVLCQQYVCVVMSQQCEWVIFRFAAITQKSESDGRGDVMGRVKADSR